uniref:Uncharacterized protein n=1 Tax=Micrurus surinamensis TaxID=129470 RepID=A0A2D4Q6S4_MICSU
MCKLPRLKWLYIIMMIPPDASPVISPDVSLEEDEPVLGMYGGELVNGSTQLSEKDLVQTHRSRTAQRCQVEKTCSWSQRVMTKRNCLLQLIQEHVGQRKGRSKEGQPYYW